MENHQLTLLDETVIAVKVNDPYKIVRKVEGVVLEDTTGLVFPFHDDGKKGDTEANDDIWSIQVKVPYDSWAGTFTFKITAYNAEHEAIIVRDNLDEVSPMTTTLNVEVQQSKPVVDVPAP
jgi:cytochrome c556